MIAAHALAWLRCPIDPAREATLSDEETHLSCSRCQVKFRIRDGVPNLIPDEAELPNGCAHRKNLPCQKGGPSRQ